MKQKIDRAYFACQRLADKLGAGRYLEAAVDLAEQGERQHRRAGGRYALSVPYTAKYFAVRWFLDVNAGKAPMDWMEAATVRADVVQAYAAASWILRSKNGAEALSELRTACADCLAIEYSKEIVVDTDAVAR